MEIYIKKKSTQLDGKIGSGYTFLERASKIRKNWGSENFSRAPGNRGAPGLGRNIFKVWLVIYQIKGNGKCKSVGLLIKEFDYPG